MKLVVNIVIACHLDRKERKLTPLGMRFLPRFAMTKRIAMTKAIEMTRPPTLNRFRRS